MDYDISLVGRRRGPVLLGGPDMEKVAFCPTCGDRWLKSVQGYWTGFPLWEAVCRREHYWACDIATAERLFPLGYRMNRDGSINTQALAGNEKYNCWPDPKGRPLQQWEQYEGGRDTP